MARARKLHELLAQSGHGDYADECPLSGVRRTFIEAPEPRSLKTLCACIEALASFFAMKGNFGTFAWNM